MIITIASGKGGTGKTTLAVNLAYALARRGETVRLLDCDCEEPNDHLFVRPEFVEQRPVCVPKPVWDAARCTGCGKCADACNYNAVSVIKGKVLIFSELCHSCGVCTHVCPEDALHEEEVEIGVVEANGTPDGAVENAPFLFAHGLLNIGEALAPNVVREVKTYASQDVITIIDASPGTACPVVEAVQDADAVLLVTEPTPFGLNDLKLAANLALTVGVPTGIVINRSTGEDELIADYSAAVDIPVSGRIPFKREYAEAYSRGQILVEEFPELGDYLLHMFDNLALSLPPVPAQECIPEQLSHTADFSLGTAERLRELSVISGKGGTGKTTLMGAMAQLAEHGVLADNDVDAADLHLLLKPDVCEVHDFVGGVKATVDPVRCIACGQCAAACHFNAVCWDGPKTELVERTYRIDPFACEGCGLCTYVCPQNAISRNDAVTGQWFVSRTQWGPMVHARLGIAEENSGRLVAKVRQRARELSLECRQESLLNDGPPGTGCPVIASVSGTDLVLIVTEPTVSGAHDMDRVLKLAAHFRVPALVVINKADLNAEQAQRITEIARAHHSEVIGRIPFDPHVNQALMAGKTVLAIDCPATTAIRRIWQRVRDALLADAPAPTT